MAFFKKAAGFLSKTTSARISQEVPSSRLSIFQVIRCMSSSKVFVGGLSYNTDDTSLREAFDKYGEVAEARVIVDRETGRSRGFGFITYSSSEEASAAIQALDQQDLHGRRIRVNYANDRTRGYGGGGGYNSGGFGGGGAGGYGGGGYGGGAGGYGGGYGGGGAGSFGGGSNYGSGVGSFGNSAETNSYGGQNFGVAGGAGGSDKYFGGGAANSGYEGGFGTGETNDLGTGGNEQSEANYGDDDETPDNYADRRS